jgi:sRNA-binding carbon storage regulator CsrA
VFGCGDVSGHLVASKGSRLIHAAAGTPQAVQAHVQQAPVAALYSGMKGLEMTLKLRRGENEELVIGDEIRLKFVDFKQHGGGCYVLVDAPRDIPVHRGEIHAKIEAERNAK